MSSATHPADHATAHTCEALGVCQARPVPCTGCSCAKPPARATHPRTCASPGGQPFLWVRLAGAGWAFSGQNSL